MQMCKCAKVQMCKLTCKGVYLLKELVHFLHRIDRLYHQHEHPARLFQPGLVGFRLKELEYLIKQSRFKVG